MLVPVPRGNHLLPSPFEPTAKHHCCIFKSKRSQRTVKTDGNTHPHTQKTDFPLHSFIPWQLSYVNSNSQAKLQGRHQWILHIAAYDCLHLPQFVSLTDVDLFIVCASGWRVHRHYRIISHQSLNMKKTNPLLSFNDKRRQFWHSHFPSPYNFATCYTAEYRKNVWGTRNSIFNHPKRSVNK